MRSVQNILSLLAVLLTVGSYAQTISVCGTVSDLNGNPVVNQTVYLSDSLSGSTATAITDSTGDYCASLGISVFGTQGMVLGYTQDCNNNFQYQTVFFTPGTSSVTLNFSICVTGSPSNSCSASFVYDTTAVANQIQFTSTSTGTAPFTYSWDFGDGNSSSQANPLHQYNSGSAFGATLTVTDSAGCIATYYDTVFSGPVNCSALAFQSANGPTVSFSGYFYGVPPVTYLWAFGDGSTSSMKNPVHTYVNAGTYNVTMVGTDSYGCSDTVYLTAVASGNSGSCQASWTGTSVAGTTTVNFSSQITGGSGPFSYLWNFGDGSTSTSANPAHTYNAMGHYNVCLTISDSICTDTYCDSVLVGMGSSCSVFASASSNALAVNLYASAWGTAPYTYSWSLPNGQTSSLQNPVIQSLSQGIYTACVSITDATGCTSSDCVAFSVGGTNNCQAAFAMIPDTVAIAAGNLTFDFIDLSTGSPYSWSWNFGDGGTSNAQNPSHTYSSLGIYAVTLQIQDSSNNCVSIALDSLVIDSSFTLAPITVNFSYINLGNNTIMFTNLSGLVQGNFSYYWEFGDGNSSTIENPTHHYGAQGTYNVCLLVTGNDGMTYRHCDDQVEATITVGMGELEDKVSAPYPNPSNVGVYLDLGRDIQIESVQMTDVQGRLMELRWEQMDDRVYLEPVGNAEGLYLISLWSDETNWNRRIIFK
jgi:PKD repeat protein